MNDLTGTAKVIFDEVMDEIDEEIREAFETLISSEKIEEIIKEIQENSKEKVVATIHEEYSDKMSAVKKLILGEKISRVVTANAKTTLRNLVTDILKHSFNVVDELRNEIIGEVFEETE